MTDQVSIQFVKGGFIVTTLTEDGKKTETEIVATPRKLQQLIKEKVEALSTTPNTEE
jgi:hypothetical protein